MNPAQTFQQYLTTTSVHIPIVSFAINLFLSAVLSFILAILYERYADSISNRTIFARNFLLITMTTMLIISIVKSSLALSLGLVGALSIVRFRAAIKEPEELAYLFLAIGIGLGLGADQVTITILAFTIISSILMLRKYFLYSTQNTQNLHLTISSHNPHRIELGEVLDTLKRHCSSVDLKRFDETKDALEASFFVEIHDSKQLLDTKNALRELSESLKVSFLDNKAIV